MTLSWAVCLLSLGTTYQGAAGWSVRASISSRARAYSVHRLRAVRSMGESFQRFQSFFRRDWKRRSCSSSDTSSQSLITFTPALTKLSSNRGASRKKLATCDGVANPLTFSTPARLYQERSKSTISPGPGRCAANRWKYQLPISRSDGLGSAATRQMRGDMGAEMRETEREGAKLRSDVREGSASWPLRKGHVLTPPLPAASRPSKMTATFRPSARMVCWSLTSSIWRRPM